MFKIVIGLIAFMLSNFVYAEDKDTNDIKLLCIADVSTGLVYKNNNWISSKIKHEGQRYIVKKLKKGEVGYKDDLKRYGLSDFGSAYPTSFCDNPAINDGFVICKGVGEFMYSPVSKRFMFSYLHGYWEGNDNNKDTPHITIGKCSEI